MKYTKKRHLQLLRTVKDPARDFLEQKKEQNGKVGWMDVLEIPDFEEDENLEELRKCNSMVSIHLHWENRIQYFELIQKILDDPFDFRKLREKIDVIQEASEYLLNNKVLIEPNKKSTEFFSLLFDIVNLQGRCSPGEDEETRLTEEEFKKIIKKILVKMKKYD